MATGVHVFSRRAALLGAAAGLAALTAGSSAGADDDVPYLPSTAKDQPFLPNLRFQGYHSPRNIRPFIDDLPILPRRRLGGNIVAAEALHEFHSDMPPAPSWGFDGVGHLGPVIEAQRGEVTRTTFVNGLGRHVMADYVDLSLHGVVPEDIDRPPLVVHLHGAPNSPVDDGYPTAIIRPGQYIDYTFGNDLEAAPLWYHDHSMGTTRLSLYAGLAAPYWVRDEFDTGEDDNPLGLPAGEYEVPLVISDKIFTREGRLRYDSVRTNILQHHWNGGLSGDVMVVNGKAWPNMMVDKGIYRLRLTSMTSINDYRFGFSNGMPFWVIGSDAGLLDKPVKVAALDMSSAERYDILVDFTQFEEGDQAELYNLVQIAWLGQFGGNAWVRDVMRFTGTGKPGRYTRIPDTLRGAKKQPKALPPLATPTEPPVTHTMNLNLNREGEWIARVNMNIDNLEFDAPEVDIARAGSVEQWNLVNADVSLETHSIHIHLAHMRVLGRQDFDRRRYVYEQDSPGHLGDRKWAPSAEDYVQGPLEPPAPYETGWKDTVRCPRGQITRVIIRWPTAEELGFDPDAPFSAPDGTPLQGYVWHCHMPDHEDNVMMRRLRIVDAAIPRDAVPMPDMPMHDMPMSGHQH